MTLANHGHDVSRLPRQIAINGPVVGNTLLALDHVLASSSSHYNSFLGVPYYRHSRRICKSSTMSVFLTPPRSSPRDKESRVVASNGPRVVWSEENSIHLLSPSGSSPLAPISLNTEPRRSILKKPSLPILSTLDENQREVTPEPEDFKQDYRYLLSPIEKITAVTQSLSDLIEAYSVLAARLRTCYSREEEPKSSWPLLRPIKDNADALAASMVRDLGRAAEDPIAVEDDENRRPPLPSPRPSPQKKRGMSADQVRNARDLCTTCHSVIRMLGIMLSESSLLELFTGMSRNSKNDISFY
jgi:hypothetical protein